MNIDTRDDINDKAAGVSALVLAAGKGRRFDSTGVLYKLVQPLADGRSIIRTVCDTLLDCIDDITVVCGPREAEVTRALSGLPVRPVHCPDADLGMGASIKCGIRASQARIGWLIMLGDMPHIDASTIATVAQHLRDGALMARPFYHNRPGHPVGFSVALTSELLSLDDSDGARALIRRNASALARIDTDDPGCVRDIDTPGDLQVHFRG